jgi:hypothetical protein
MLRPMFRQSGTIGSPAPQNNKNGFGVSIFNNVNIAPYDLKNQEFADFFYAAGKS